MLTNTKCSICFEYFDDVRRIPKLFNCRARRHIFCYVCVQTLAMQNPDRQLCIHQHRNCDAEIPHWTCALCRDTVHVPNGGIDSLPTVPVSALSKQFDSYSYQRHLLSNRQCPYCHDNFCYPDKRPTILPCRDGHVFCFSCCQHFAEKPAPFESCHFLRCGCDKNFQHVTCPTCMELVHIPEGGVDILVTLPITCDHLEDRRNQVIKRVAYFRNQLYSFYDLIQNFSQYSSQFWNICRLTLLAAVLAGCTASTLGVLDQLSSTFPFAFVGHCLGGSSLFLALGSAVTGSIYQSYLKKQIGQLGMQVNLAKLHLADIFRLYRFSCKADKKLSEAFPDVVSCNFKLSEEFGSSCHLKEEDFELNHARSNATLIGGIQCAQLIDVRASTFTLPLNIVLLYKTQQQFSQERGKKRNEIENLEKFKDVCDRYLDGLEQRMKKLHENSRRF